MWLPSKSASVIIIILSYSISLTSKLEPYPAPIVLIIVAISSLAKMSASFAFSVLIIFPLNGSIAWYFLSLPPFAEPPAELPSTKNSSFLVLSFDWAGTNLPDNVRFFDEFLPFLISSIAFLAAYLACLLFCILSIKILAILLFSSK